MTEHTTYNEDESIININKNGIDVQAKATVDEHEIVLEVEGDMFVITKDDLV